MAKKLKSENIFYKDLKAVGEKEVEGIRISESSQGLEQEDSNCIDTIEKLKAEVEKYDRNEGADFSNVKWSKLVTDKDFTEDMVIRFQIQIQNYYEDYVKSHKVSDSLIRKMYYDFLGVFMIDWLPVKEQHRIFPELFENV